LLTILISQPASTQLTAGLNVHNFPIKSDGVYEKMPFTMTLLQLKLSRQYPELFQSLVIDASKVFDHECKRNFRHERWNCSNINLPTLLGPTTPFLTLGKPRVRYHM